MSAAQCPECDQVFEDHDTKPEWPGERRCTNHMQRSGHTGSPVILDRPEGPPAPVPELPPPPVDEPRLFDPPAATPPQGAVPTDEDPPASAAAPGRSAGAGPPPAERRGLMGRFRGRKGRTERPPKSEPAPARPKPARAPRGSKRESAAATLGDVFGFGGSTLQRMGHVPTGRMVTFQAPITGELADELLADTAVDRAVLQRLVKGRGVLDKLFAMFGPTVLTFRLEQAVISGDQAAVDQTQYLLREAVRNSLPVMIPAMKKARERERRTNAAMADLLGDEDLEAMGLRKGPNGQPVDRDGKAVDVADLFVQMLFDGWGPPDGGRVVDVQPEAPAEETTT